MNKYMNIKWAGIAAVAAVAVWMTTGCETVNQLTQTGDGHRGGVGRHHDQRCRRASTAPRRP